MEKETQIVRNGDRGETSAPCESFTVVLISAESLWVTPAGEI